MWGTQVQDTVGIFLTAYHTNEISWIRKPKAKFEFVRDGTIFMIGGVAYTALHVINDHLPAHVPQQRFCQARGDA